MKTVIAIVLGMLSGLLIYMICGMLFMDMGPTHTAPSPALVLLPFLAGWAASAFLLRRGAASISKVFSRGALLGAAEWIAVAAAGIVFSGRAVAHAGSGSDAAKAGAAVGGGLVAIVTGGLAIAMAVVCLIVFAIAYFAGREMADRTGTPTRKCPDCAEMVQAEARKCKHCGASLVATGALAPQ